MKFLIGLLAIALISGCVELSEPCTPEGNSSMPPHNCCPGLDLVADCLPGEACPISLRYCVDCGDGMCDAHENWHNCPEDCSEAEKPTHHGTSTNGTCSTDEDCIISGCNAEICQSKNEEVMASICIYNPPYPKDLGLDCRCVDQGCRWANKAYF